MSRDLRPFSQWPVPKARAGTLAPSFEGGFLVRDAEAGTVMATTSPSLATHELERDEVTGTVTHVPIGTAAAGDRVRVRRVSGDYRIL